MDAGITFMSIFSIHPTPNTIRTRRKSRANAASLNCGAAPKKNHRKILRKHAVSTGHNVEPRSRNIRLAHNRRRAMLTAEEHLVDVLLNRKSRCRTNQPKVGNSKPKGCLMNSFWKRFITLFKISTKPNCTIARTPGQETATIIDANPAIKHPSPIIVTTLQYSEVNARVAAVCIPASHSHRQASILSLPTLGSPKHHPLTNSTNSQSSPQIYHPPRGSKVMSLENEAKIDKVMERVTGINCRRGLGMQSEDIASGLSYGYGFYWTCCNDICAKARVMGNLGGVMEVTVKGPCKRKNSLAEEKCGECGHSICAICEKIAECAGSNKEKRGGHLTD